MAERVVQVDTEDVGPLELDELRVLLELSRRYWMYHTDSGTEESPDAHEFFARVGLKILEIERVKNG